MKVRDSKVGRLVDVYEKACLSRECYWARQDPGSFTPGKGYTHRSNDWLCGTREIRGCPDHI